MQYPVKGRDLVEVGGRTKSQEPIGPCEHVVHIYENDRALLVSLEEYVLAGLEADEGILSIATNRHQKALDIQLLGRGVDVAALRDSGQYTTPNAEEMLSEFMIGGWPDEARFQATIGRLLARARKGGRRVRAFGEMVAILWARGQSGATMQLEHYWHALCRAQSLPLFCAYPSSGFTPETWPALQSICLAHTRVITEP